MSKARILITRPREDATQLATLLEHRGYATLVESMLTIEPMYENEKPLEHALARQPQAILVTSRYAINILAKMTTHRAIPIVAVGKVTAHYALELGFSLVTVAGGTARSLISYALAQLKAENGHLLYVCGTDISTDIESELINQRFQVETIRLYHAHPEKHLSSALQKALNERALAAALFFSQRTVATYIALAKAAKLEACHDGLLAVALSEPIAKSLSVLPWKKIVIAPESNTDSMLMQLEQVLSVNH